MQKQAVRIAKRIKERAPESLFEPPALTVQPAIETLPPADGAAGHSIATTDVIPGLRSVTPKIHRKENDDGGPAPAPVPAPPPDAPGSKGEQLNAGATGTTNILAPTVSSKTYSGKTLQDVSNAMPEESGSLTFDIGAATDGDPITRATVTVKQSMVLPRWAERDKQCKPIQAAWDRFASALRQHEDGHVKINQQQFGSAHSRYAGRPKGETQDVTTELENETFAANTTFDTQTNHGKTGSPSTTIDVGVKCDDKGTSTEGGGEEELFQMKLEVSEPGDPDEEEADRVAEQVLRMAEPGGDESQQLVTRSPVVQRCAACDAEEEKWKTETEVESGVKVRRKCAECAAKEKETASSRVVDVTRSGGQPLDADTRAFMEPRFGFDFSRVRIHTDSRAAEAAHSVNARAYTLGGDVVFSEGRYAPETAEGRRLLAHELTHVVQQGSVRPASDRAAASAIHSSRTSIQRGATLVQRDTGPAGMTSPTAPASVVAPPPAVGKSEDFRKRVSSPLGGVYAGKKVGTWGKLISSDLTTTSRDSRNSVTLDEASASARSLGKPACILKEPVYLSEKDKNDPTDAFVVYTMSVDSVWSFTAENTKLSGGARTSSIKGLASVPVLQFITEDGVVVAPEVGKDGEANYGTLMTQQDKPPGSDPFSGPIQALGPGLTGLRSGNAEKDKAAFLRYFELALRDTAQTVIATSETNAISKRDELGAKGVSEDEWKRIDEALPELIKLNDQIARISGPTGEIARTSSQERIEQLADELDRLNEKRNLQLNRYPLLSQFNEEDLRSFAAMDRAERTKKLQGAATDVLADINKTRDNIRGGAVDVWELGPLVEATLQGLQVKDADFRQWAMAKAKFAKNVGMAFDLALGVIQLGLGLAATALTGGTAAVAFAAGALTVGVVSASKQTADYFRDKAAANTDIDKRKALNPQDLDGQWAWIAVAWIGLIGDASVVMEACAAASKGGLTLEKAAERVAERVKRTPSDLINVAKRAMDPLTAERARAALMLAIKADLRKSLEGVKVTVLPDKEFAARFGSSKGQAVTLVTQDAKGATSIEVVVKSTAPERAIADEAVHLEQSLDPELAKKMARATAAEAGWEKLAIRDQLSAYADKLEVEADACRRQLKDMHPEDLSRHEVEGVLKDLESRSKDVKAALAETSPEAMAKRVPWFDPQQPPFLFAKARLPKSDGVWSDPSQPGDCLWYSNLPEVKAITGGKGIPFRDGYPVFKDWAHVTVVPEAVGAKMADCDRQWARQIERLGKRSDYPDFFRIGERELPRGECNQAAIERWRTENSFTWHHHQGEGNLMLLLPRGLHGNVPHTGRMAIARGTHVPE